MKAGSAIAIVAALALGAVWFARAPSDGVPGETQRAALAIPEFTAEEAAGQALFDQNCAQCHGGNAAGSDRGPPLVHRIYEPNHHGDMAFVLAARQGVREHHWDFGSMPPVDGVDDDDVSKIIEYVRALQRANGVY